MHIILVAIFLGVLYHNRLASSSKVSIEKKEIFQNPDLYPGFLVILRWVVANELP